MFHIYMYFVPRKDIYTQSSATVNNLFIMNVAGKFDKFLWLSWQLRIGHTWKGACMAARLANQGFFSRASITKGISSIPGAMMALRLRTTCPFTNPF